tara:strand:- start:687 stop:1058 length:372 start_codon:yes stop_codon:yes gene_type:complete
MHEEPETYKFDDLLDVESISPTQPEDYPNPSDSDKARIRMRHILPYGVIIEDGIESLFNRNHVKIQSRKAISEKSGVFFDDGCSPWKYLGQSTDSRLRCEAVLLAWVLEKPLDHYLYKENDGA